MPITQSIVTELPVLPDPPFKWQFIGKALAKTGWNLGWTLNGRVKRADRLAAVKSHAELLQRQVTKAREVLETAQEIINECEKDLQSMRTVWPEAFE